LSYGFGGFGCEITERGFGGFGCEITDFGFGGFGCEITDFSPTEFSVTDMAKFVATTTASATISARNRFEWVRFDIVDSLVMMW